MTTVTGTVQNPQQVEGTVLDPARVTAEVLVAIKGDKGDPGDIGGGMDGEFTEVIYDSQTGMLDIGSIDSDKINFDTTTSGTSIVINQFGNANAGVQKQLLINMINSEEVKIANSYADEVGNDIIGLVDNDYLVLSRLISERYVLDLISKGGGSWLITGIRSNLQNFDYVINEWQSFDGEVAIIFDKNEVYTKVSMQSDTEIILNTDFESVNKNGIKKKYIIISNSFGYELTFGSGITLLSGTWDNRIGFRNIIDLIYVDTFEVYATISSMAISNSVAIKGSTADQLSLLPISLTSGEFFELQQTANLLPSQWYLLSGYYNENIYIFTTSNRSFYLEGMSKDSPYEKIWFGSNGTVDFTYNSGDPQLGFAFTSKNVLTLDGYLGGFNPMFEKRIYIAFPTLVLLATVGELTIELLEENEGILWRYDKVLHTITLLGAYADSAFSFLDVATVEGANMYLNFNYSRITTRQGEFTSACHDQDGNSSNVDIEFTRVRQNKVEKVTGSSLVPDNKIALIPQFAYFI